MLLIYTTMNCPNCQDIFDNLFDIIKH